MRAGTTEAALPIRNSQLLVLTLAVTVLHGLIALAISSQRFSYGTIGFGNMWRDIDLFRSYGLKAMAGMVPYRDYLIEYPFLAFPVFLLPALVSTTIEGYRIAFGLEMLLADAVTVYLVARQVAVRDGWERVPGRLAWYTLAFASLCPLIMARFDLVAMALTFAAASAWFSGRRRLGGALAAIGTLVKIVPGVIVAPALVQEFSGRKSEQGRGVFWYAVTMAAGMVVWFAVGGWGIENSISYHMERGIEIGSIYAGVVMIAARATGAPLDFAPSHWALDIITPWSSFAAKLGFPLQVAALLLVMERFRRSRDGDFARYGAAALLAFIVFSKILSPQYLAWLFPFIAVLPGRTGLWARGLFLFACVLTALIYPFGWHWLLQFRGPMIGILNYRNVILLGLWGFLLLAPDGPPAQAKATA